MDTSVASAVVALTDRAWFDHFRPTDTLVHVDEVNFWRPLAQDRFASLPVGGPFFFRLKAPVNAIVGYGFFAHATALDVRTAWNVFGNANGDPNFEQFLSRIARYRKTSPDRLLVPSAKLLNCIVLRGAVFLPQSAWLLWNEAHGWSRNIVAYKKYDGSNPATALLTALLEVPPAVAVPDLLPQFEPLTTDERVIVSQAVAQREGQGTFRARLLDAYSGRCAVTGEHTVPVLDAAHIQPYRGPASNHPQNGLVLRSDVHRLFDLGYLTVTPEYRLVVSGRLREDYQNGRVYYALDGERVTVPERADVRPSGAALQWHADHVFLG